LRRRRTIDGGVLSCMPVSASSTPPSTCRGRRQPKRWPSPSRRAPPRPPSMSSLPRRRGRPVARGGDLSGTISAGSRRGDMRRSFYISDQFLGSWSTSARWHNPSRAPRQSFAQCHDLCCLCKDWVNGKSAMVVVSPVGHQGHT
jgi:hypothetical protein